MMNDTALAALLIFLVFVVIPLPSWIAKFRKHPNFSEIAVLNVLLLWTGIGWMALLIWAASGRELKWLERFRAKRNSSR